LNTANDLAKKNNEHYSQNKRVHSIGAVEHQLQRNWAAVVQPIAPTRRYNDRSLEFVLQNRWQLPAAIGLENIVHVRSTEPVTAPA
jgi:hypothetical protein